MGNTKNSYTRISFYLCSSVDYLSYVADGVDSSDQSEGQSVEESDDSVGQRSSKSAPTLAPSKVYTIIREYLLLINNYALLILFLSLNPLACLPYLMTLLFT